MARIQIPSGGGHEMTRVWGSLPTWGRESTLWVGRSTSRAACRCESVRRPGCASHNSTPVTFD